MPRWDFYCEHCDKPSNWLFSPTEILKKLSVLNAAARSRASHQHQTLSSPATEPQPDTAEPNYDRCTLCGASLIGKPRMCAEHGTNGVTSAKPNYVETPAGPFRARRRYPI